MRYWSQWVGIFAGAGLLYLAIGPDNFRHFLNAPSLVVVVGLTGCGLLAAFGLQGYKEALIWLLGRPVDSAKIRDFGKAGAVLAVGSGGLGALIGMVLMLQNLDDPGALGPGMAVASLTSIYGLTLAILVFAPMIFTRDKQEPTTPSNGHGSSTALLVSGMVLLPLVVMSLTWLLLNLSFTHVSVPSAPTHSPAGWLP